MKSYSILVVDDSQTDRYLLRRSIEKATMIGSVFEAENGKEALELLKNGQGQMSPFPPVIVFVDVNMPLLNGFEFLELYSKLREENSRFDACNIVMFSSSENPDDRKKALSYKFVRDYMVKGAVGPKVLREKVISVINELK